MPVHDWTRVKAGIFHDFHNSWIVHLKEALNNGVLPAPYYALCEQHAGKVITDILTLRDSETEASLSSARGAVAVAEAPPRVSRKMTASENAAYRSLRKTLAIRHSSGDRLVALIEILSPANKDRAQSVRDFVEKAIAILRAGCHLLVVDLFPPRPHEPHGIHGAIWEYFDPQDFLPPADKPSLQVAYEARDLPEAHVEPIAVGDRLSSMPLFLQMDWYVPVALEDTYEGAFSGVPAVWRAVLENSLAQN